jgi:hypothetical protein
MEAAPMCKAPACQLNPRTSPDSRRRHMGCFACCCCCCCCCLRNIRDSQSVESTAWACEGHRKPNNQPRHTRATRPIVRDSKRLDSCMARFYLCHRLKQQVALVEGIPTNICAGSMHDNPTRNLRSATLSVQHPQKMFCMKQETALWRQQCRTCTYLPHSLPQCLGRAAAFMLSSHFFAKH